MPKPSKTQATVSHGVAPNVDVFDDRSLAAAPVPKRSTPRFAATQMALPSAKGRPALALQEDGRDNKRANQTTKKAAFVSQPSTSPTRTIAQSFKPDVT